MAQKCNLVSIARKIREARKQPVASKMRPLHRHILMLAADSARRGYCQRAGIEVRMANKISRESPDDLAYARAVRAARTPRKRRRR